MKVNLADKLSLFTSFWDPKVVSRYNDNDVMVVKIKGAFPWHSHPDTDDFFMVIEGHVRIETEAGHHDLAPGEICVVPKGVRHRPVAENEAHLLLIEPVGTPNTGDVTTATAKQPI